MKTSKEMARNVLLRRDAYQARQRQRRRAAGIGLGCLAVALLAGFGIWRVPDGPGPGGGTLTHPGRAADGLSTAEEPIELEYDAAAPLNPDDRPDEWEVDPCPVNEGGEVSEPVTAPGRKNPMEEPSFYEEEAMDEPDETELPDAPHTEAGKERIDGETPPDVGEPRIEPEDGPAAENPGGLGTIAVDWDYAFYAGSYTDESGRFVVLLTENTAENQEKVCQLHGFDRNTAVFQTAEYDLGYLSSLQAKISERMQSGVFSFIISCSLREDLNRVVVETSTDSAEMLRPLLALDERGGALVVNTGNRLPGEKPGAVTE